MNKISQLTHSDVSSMVMHYLSSKLIADNKSQKDDILKCNINGVPINLIAPVKRKHTDSLEKRIDENSKKGEATGVIFPKSSESYNGNYLKDEGRYEFSGGGKKRWHNMVNLSTAEAYLLDMFGNPLTYYDPVSNSIEKMRLRRIPDYAISEIRRINAPSGIDDARIWDNGRRLKEEHGKGHSLKIMNPLERARYVEMAKFAHAKDELREKLSVDKIKDYFTIDVKENRGVLIAHVVPYVSTSQIQLL